MAEKPPKLRGTILPENGWKPIVRGPEEVKLSPTEKLANALELQELEHVVNLLQLLLKNPKAKKAITPVDRNLLQQSIIDTKLFIKRVQQHKETPQAVRDMKSSISQKYTLAQEAFLAYETITILNGLLTKDNRIWIKQHIQNITDLDQPAAYTYARDLVQVKTYVDTWRKKGYIEEFEWWNILKYARPSSVLSSIYLMDSQKGSEEQDKQLVQTYVKEFMGVVLKDAQGI